MVDFSDPYYAGGLVIMVQKNNQTIHGPADLADKKIAVQVGTKSVQFVKEHFPKAQVFEVEKNQEMFNMLETGRADAVVKGKPAAKLYARVRQTTRVLDEQLTVEQYGVVVGKNHPELTQSINQALKTLKSNGVYDALVKKWFESASS
ncbi:Glutamine-binding periplasmic protein [Sodalis praecaptivus]